MGCGPRARTPDSPRDPRRRPSRDALAAVAHLWAAPPSAGDHLDEGVEPPAPTATRLVHGDLHARHLLLDDAGGLTGDID